MDRNKKIMRSFRMEKETIDRLLLIQKIYEKELGMSVSQSDVIKKLVDFEYESLDKR